MSGKDKQDAIMIHIATTFDLQIVSKMGGAHSPKEYDANVFNKYLAPELEDWETCLGDGHYGTAKNVFTPIEEHSDGTPLTEAELHYNSTVRLYRAQHERVNKLIKRGAAFQTKFRHRYQLAAAVAHFSVEMTSVWLRLCPVHNPLCIGPWPHGPPPTI